MQNFQLRANRRDNRTRFVYYPKDQGRMVKVELGHRDGGMNHFSGATEKRGIEVNVSVIEVGQAETSGYRVESYAPMSDCNARYLVLETPRYNKGKLEAIAAALDADLPRLTEAWEQDISAGKQLMVEIAERAAQAA